jgi:hypothetical protein
MLKGAMMAHDGKKWGDFPVTPDEWLVWEWFRSLKDRSLPVAHYKLYITETANQFKDQKGHMDLFLQMPASNSGRTFIYKNVLVIGEHKKSYDKSRFKEDLLQFTRYVRSVFADQATHRYIHGSMLCASIMELWIFDRSGPYSLGTLDFHGDPGKFSTPKMKRFVPYAQHRSWRNEMEADVECWFHTEDSNLSLGNYQPYQGRL